MKYINKIIIAGLLLFAFTCGLKAEDNIITISGMVRDGLTRRPLQYVTITVANNNIGTVSNADGEFSLKIPQSINATVVEFSHLGYQTFRLSITGENMSGVQVAMTQSATELSELVVQGFDAFYIVQEAVSKIPTNFSASLNQLTGFYRETVQKRRNYINISEAVVDLYKTAYSESVSADRLQVLKGRRLLSQRASDTLAIKLLGGPNLSIFVDIVKNPDILLDRETLSDLSYTMVNITQINGRDQYVINFDPRVVKPYPLYQGTLYIDRESLAFTRAEFNLDMSDRNKATSMILRRRPLGLRFRPEQVSYVVSYQERNGVSYLSYIRNELHFSCDWRRRLFSTNYSVVSEMVVTDINLQDVAMIARRDAFRETHVLTDRVLDFYDEDFWGAYNIIEPTESLELAVNRLLRQQRQ